MTVGTSFKCVSGGVAAGATGAVSVITTPLNIASHCTIPYLTTDQKVGMSILDVGVGIGGVVLAYAIANFWNPTGWLAVAAVAGLTYTGLTALGSWALESYFVEDNKKKYGW